MLKVKRLLENATLPQKAHAGDLGYDLFAAEAVTIFPDETIIISTGIAIQFPEGYGGFIKDRSSVSTKHSVFAVAGVIDNGYVGEIKVALHNAGEDPWYCVVGSKIAQLVLIPTTNFMVEEVDEVLSSDQRGKNGFGSTDTPIPYPYDNYE
jgi:dUTP pyrophosphatase